MTEDTFKGVTQSVDKLAVVFQRVSRRQVDISNTHKNKPSPVSTDLDSYTSFDIRESIKNPQYKRK